jgi:pimeloyl-ACP methyl ester carboxylesterase
MGQKGGSGISRRALLGGALAVAGCANLPPPPRPPLQQLYAATATSPEQPPLIVVPGTFGSRLRDTVSDRIIWPGSDMKLILSRFDDLELEIDPDTLEARPSMVVPDGIFEEGFRRDFFGKLLHTLRTAGGYQLRRLGEPPDAAGRAYYIYDYDWRCDSVAAVAGLHAMIEGIRSDYGDPQLKVDIVAHSAGGLIARYYARFGTAPLPDTGLPQTWCEGPERIRRLITLGTPNLGTIQPVLSHIRGEEIGLRMMQPDVVATCIAVPQLMPHDDIAWLIDTGGRVIPRSAFAVETWREFGWSVFDPQIQQRAIARHGGGAAGRAYLETLQRYFAKCLTRGRAFTNALESPLPGCDVAPHVFGADCSPTLARLVVEYVDGRAAAREQPSNIAGVVQGVDYQTLMFQPGDQVVTRESLLGRCTAADSLFCKKKSAMRIEHSVFLCEKHQSLTGNLSFQNNLLFVLLSM